MTRLHTLFDIINIEPKAVVFYHLTPDFQTITDIVDKVAHTLPELQPPINKQNIYKYTHTVLGQAERGLVEEAEVTGRRKRAARAWRLTRYGQDMQPLVGYALPFLPERYELSAVQIMGAMNSSSEKRATYARIDMLLALAAGQQNITMLRELDSMGEKKVSRHLGELAELHNCNGMHLPFVEATGHVNRTQGHLYSWTGKAPDESDFAGLRNSAAYQRNVLDFLVTAGKGIRFDSRKIHEANAGYTRLSHLSLGLRTLEAKGYVSVENAQDMNVWQLTEHSKVFVRDCLQPIISAVKEDKQWMLQIQAQQPSPSQLVHAVQTYRSATGTAAA